MNLCMVTYEGDLTQFLVDRANGDPISQAIEANLDDKYLGMYDEQDIRDMKDRVLYEIDAFGRSSSRKEHRRIRSYRRPEIHLGSDP